MIYARLPVKARLTVRGYATVHEKRSRRTNSQSPDFRLIQWPRCSECTPYNILEQARTEPYNKRRFHELVRVYHPDRWQHATYHGVSKATRVERYRLLVLANAILSDPLKRKAYDEYGVGWDGGGHHGSPERRTNGDDDLAQGWSQQPGQEGVDATWDGWEQWGRQGQDQNQGLIILRNESLGLVLALFLTLGGCCLYAQAYYRVKEITQQCDKVHTTISEDLWRIKNQAESSSRENRVKAFVNHRASLVLAKDFHS
ncbi:hypothetical protein MGN70_008193 [Eutypa lata]|nr:hypothetical protein MGN70_008193 [Eutypa lata]